MLEYLKDLINLQVQPHREDDFSQLSTMFFSYMNIEYRRLKEIRHILSSEEIG